MQFPSFDDFMATLSPDTVAGIMGDANAASRLVKPDKLTYPEDAAGLQVLSISFQVSLELLAVYHKWLEQQL